MCTTKKMNEKRLVNFLQVCIVLSTCIISLRADCIWYGECGTNQYGAPLNCCLKPTSPAKSFPNNTNAIAILRNRCPNFFDDNGDVIDLCCDDEQVLTMENGINEAAQVFQRCPSCIKNLEQSICEMTCSPNQTQFLNNVKCQKDKTTHIQVVVNITYHLSYSYMNFTYESCKGIIQPSTQDYVMNIACGQYNYLTCDAQKWFTFMGNAKENSETPFNIVYDSSEFDGMLYLNDVYPCYEAYPGDVACSCVDCANACPFIDPTVLDSGTFTIGVVNGPALITAILLLVLGITAIITVIIIKKRRKLKTINDVAEDVQKQSKDNILVSCGKSMNKAFETFFRWWGTGIANRPYLVLMLCSWFIIGCVFGIAQLEITIDPIELWAAPQSRSRLEKTYFDDHFGPFYRTEQIFFKAIDLPNIEYEGKTYGPAFNKTFLETIFQLQERIQGIVAEDGTTLDKICFAPMTSDFTGPVTISQCTVMSVFGYFQNDFSIFNQESIDKDNVTRNYLDTMFECLSNCYSVNCLAPYGGPIDPKLGLGGFKMDPETNALDYTSATAVIITISVNNYNDKVKVQPAINWEKKFIDLLKHWDLNERPEFISMAFSSESSIEFELERESAAEASTVIISYTVMFLYITLALGHIRSIKSFFVDTKILLGIGGISVMISSLLCSIGIFGYVGVATTVLTIEVLPFLVLAVGVDNVFILVQTFQRMPRNPKISQAEHVGEMLAHVGPTMLLTSLSECSCFALGALASMPAMRSFAMYAAVALLINFILQLTGFISVLTLDDLRYQRQRIDLFCCFKINNIKRENDEDKGKGILYRLWGKYYVPNLMKSPVRVVVVFVFLIWSCASICMVPSIEPGLDQQLSMPDDSYILKYFDYMNDLFSIGPPVYWVVKPGLDYSQTPVQNIICGGRGCDDFSLNVQLYSASKNPEITYMATPANSWLDDYFDWSSLSQYCCKYFTSNDSFCPHTVTGNECQPCVINLNEDGSRPIQEDFNKYLPFFLQDNPDTSCAKSGHPSYGSAVNYITNNNGTVQAQEFNMMSYHTILRTSKDFYEALRYARFISDNLTRTINQVSTSDDIEIFPYSVFYVFYEQYLTIWSDSFESLGLSLTAVFVMTLIFTGLSLFSSIIVIFTVILILLNVGGALYLWNVSLNAVSLVNLVMATGISVEFCSNIVHAYNTSKARTSLQKATDALTNMGSSVLSGITFTKFFGVIVLAFAKSQIFRVFYFRMYLCIVIVGASHGLILLPVLLSIFGANEK